MTASAAAEGARYCHSRWALQAAVDAAAALGKVAVGIAAAAAAAGLGEVLAGTAAADSAAAPGRVWTLPAPGAHEKRHASHAAAAAAPVSGKRAAAGGSWAAYASPLACSCGPCFEAFDSSPACPSAAWGLADSRYPEKAGHQEASAGAALPACLPEQSATEPGGAQWAAAAAAAAVVVADIGRDCMASGRHDAAVAEPCRRAGHSGAALYTLAAALIFAEPSPDSHAPQTAVLVLQCNAHGEPISSASPYVRKWTSSTGRPASSGKPSGVSFATLQYRTSRYVASLSIRAKAWIH